MRFIQPLPKSIFLSLYVEKNWNLLSLHLVVLGLGMVFEFLQFSSFMNKNDYQDSIFFKAKKCGVEISLAAADVY